MAAHACLSPGAVSGAMRPAERILELRDELQMPRVTTRPRAAPMVNCHPTPWRERHAMREDIGETVRIFIHGSPARLT